MIVLLLDELPPSVNHLYVQRGKFRSLSKKGQAFKNKVRAAFLDQLAEQPVDFQVTDKLRVDYLFRVPDLYTQGWPSKAKSPYRRVDVSNFVKAVEDTLFSVLGLDDSMVFEIFMQKVAGPSMTYIEIHKVGTHEPRPPQRSEPDRAGPATPPRRRRGRDGAAG